MLQTKIPLINQIKEWVKDIHGWSPIDQLYTLFTEAWGKADACRNYSIQLSALERIL